jgi:hypothetical protein
MGLHYHFKTLIDPYAPIISVIPLPDYDLGNIITWNADQGVLDLMTRFGHMVCNGSPAAGQDMRRLI